MSLQFPRWSSPPAARRLLGPLAMSLVFGCGECSCGQRAPEAAATPATLETPSATDAGAQAPDAAAADTPPVHESDTWPKLEFNDQMPMCLFADKAASFRASFIKDVTRQRLAVGAPVVVGVFAGWCVNEDCDGIPSLSCQVEREGDVLKVSSRYWGTRKADSACDGPCRPITASCDTPELERGVYTVQHGALSFELRIPSMLSDPCFGTDEHQLPPQPVQP